MKQNLTTMLGVTIAFTLGSAAIAVTAYVLSVTGADFGLAAHIDSWPHAVGLFVGNSALAGLLVDALRLTVDFVWPTGITRESNLR